MPIPSLYASGDRRQEWGVARAAGYGAGIGLAAALFKIFGPSREPMSLDARLAEIAGAALGFAVLCACAALLRNMLARRFVRRALDD